MPKSPEIEHLQNAVLAVKKVIQAEKTKPQPPTPAEEAQSEESLARERIITEAQRGESSVQ